MKESNNIESLFSKSFSNYELDPGADAWSKIQAQIQPIAPNAAQNTGNISQSNTGIWASTASKVITAVLAAGISAGAYFAYTNSAETSITKEKTVQGEKAIESKIKAPISEENTEQTTSVEAEKKQNQQYTQDKAMQLDEAETKSAINAEQSIVGSSESKSSSSQESNKTKDAVQLTKENPVKPATTSSPVIIEKQQAENSAQSESMVATEPSIKTEAKISKKAVNTVQPETIEDIENTKISAIEEPEIYIPNIFTPNQDNVNDIFNIEANEADQLQVKIFTKAGKLIHQWTGFYGFWDGIMEDGSLAPSDTYMVQVIVSKNGKDFPKQALLTLTR